MPLLQPDKKEKDISVSAKFPESLKKEMDDYIAFANLSSVNEFLNKAVKLVLTKDKDWKQHCSEK